VAGEGRRFLFRHSGETPYEVDLFIDRLQMCHTLDLRRRVTLCPETVPLIDLLLQKLQIVDLTRKDMADVVVLLADHDFGTESAGAIDLEHAAGLLSDDWGFYYTVSQNLERIGQFAHEAPVNDDVRDWVQGRLSRFRDTVESSPKTRKWKMRRGSAPARSGTRTSRKTSWRSEGSPAGSASPAPRGRRPRPLARASSDADRHAVASN
jgi:hypothetical protein